MLVVVTVAEAELVVVVVVGSEKIADVVVVELVVKLVVVGSEKIADVVVIEAAVVEPDEVLVVLELSTAPTTFIAFMVKTVESSTKMSSSATRPVQKPQDHVKSDND